MGVLEAGTTAAGRTKGQTHTSTRELGANMSVNIIARSVLIVSIVAFPLLMLAWIWTGDARWGFTSVIPGSITMVLFIMDGDL